MEKPDCYNCKFRKSIPGDSHSACGYPADIKAGFMDVLLLFDRANPIEGITFHEQGARGGYVVWPFNFDPVWLLECKYYEKKD